ncbi:hypothetical protein PVAP13_7KG321806 [Panicum virgatum]|uniref:Probable purine permease n=1 Tax=Panicum virgatum TaxID=38727 RepID=A0A8T0QH57_PANVG|nr:hypothetical protein PVAP13_7KG321806 [Panicum virgatum]
MSTYSIILASQVSFNAVFSYFLNKEKFRALILNSVVLLTFSAALVGVSHGSDGSGSDIPKGKFPAGFALTLSASALFSLILSLMQLTFEEVLKSDALPTVLEMQFWSNTAAACVSVAGLFASGEWRGIAGERAAYRKGEVAYAMTLAWTAVSWQLCTMGLMGLVAAVSSLFTNVISTVGTPLSPAVIFGPGMAPRTTLAGALSNGGFGTGSEPCQTVVLAPAPSLEPQLEPLAAYTGEEKPQNRGFVRLRGASPCRCPFCPRTQHLVVAKLHSLTHACGGGRAPATRRICGGRKLCVGGWSGWAAARSMSASATAANFASADGANGRVARLVRRCRALGPAEACGVEISRRRSEVGGAGGAEGRGGGGGLRSRRWRPADPQVHGQRELAPAAGGRRRRRREKEAQAAVDGRRREEDDGELWGGRTDKGREEKK